MKYNSFMLTLKSLFGLEQSLLKSINRVTEFSLQIKIQEELFLRSFPVTNIVKKEKKFRILIKLCSTI